MIRVTVDPKSKIRQVLALQNFTLEGEVVFVERYPMGGKINEAVRVGPGLNLRLDEDEQGVFLRFMTSGEEELARHPLREKTKSPGPPGRAAPVARKKATPKNKAARTTTAKRKKTATKSR